MSKKIIIGVITAVIVLGLVIGGLILFKHEHDVVIDKAVEPTCEEAGLTKGKHCDDCGEVIVAQKEIPALGHTITVFASIEPTCTTTGKTEGMVCTVCNKVLAEQEVIPMSDHVYDGEYDRFCNVCSFERAIDCRHDIPEKIIEYPAVEPTCEKTGLTAGKKCLICNEMIVPQIVVSKLPCVEGGWILDYPPSLAGNGKRHTECLTCGRVVREEVVYCQHDDPGKIMEIPAVAPTCEETGLTVGQQCLICGEMVVPQTVVTKLACIESNWIIDYPESIEDDAAAYTECISCGRVIREKVVSLDEIAGNAEITPLELISFYAELIANKSELDSVLTDAQERSILSMYAIYSYGNREFGIDDDVSEQGVVMDLSVLSPIYGLYFWDELAKNPVDFETILDYIVDISDQEMVKKYLDAATITKLEELSAGIDEFKETMNRELTKSEFVELAIGMFGDSLLTQRVYDMIFSLASGGSNTATLLEILEMFEGVSSIVPADVRETIETYVDTYYLISDPCEYTEFISVLETVVLNLTGEAHDVEVSDDIIQQVYIKYYDERLDAIPKDKVRLADMITFYNETAKTNELLASKVDERSKLLLLELVMVYEFVDDDNKYNRDEMSEKFVSLNDNVPHLASQDLFTYADIQKMFVYYCLNNQ